MSRLDKLKRLKDEVGRLFHERLDVNAVFNQLRTDEQFEDANRRQVQAFYSHFEEKFNAEAEDERQIAVFEQQIADYQQRIVEYEQQLAENQQQTAAHQWQIEFYERELAKKQRMKIEMEFTVKYRQNSNKFLICDESFAKWFVVYEKFWQERFFMTVKHTSGNIHTINVQDLFQGETKSFTIRKHDLSLKTHALTFPFVLLDEFNISNDVTYFRLAKLDFESEFLQVVQSFEFNGRCQVLVSASDSSKFLLRKGKDINDCNLIHGQIQIGKKLFLGSNFNVHYGSYYDKQFCRLRFRRPLNDQARSYPLTHVKMSLCDLERNENSTQDIDSTPENLVCLNPENPNYFAWIRDTVFVAIQFPLTAKHGVIFTNPQVRNWKFIDFTTDLRINCIQSFADGTLMIYSELEESKRKFYKFHLRKPDSLRNMAWTSIVKLFKEAKIVNPYEEARKYLPLNSEIQPFVFAED